MKKIVSFLLSILIVMTVFVNVPCPPSIKAEELNLYQIGVVGIMPDDYIGAFALHTANTYESDFKSDLSFPMQGMTTTPEGNIAVCDTSYGRVHILSPDLQNLLTFGEIGYGEGKLQYPADIAVDSDGNFYIADFFNNYWSKFDKNGKWILNSGAEGKDNGQLNGPSGIAVDTQGNVYVSDQLNHRIQVFDKNGSFKSVLQTEVKDPGGMCIDLDNNLYVVDMRSCSVFKLDSNGKMLLKFGSNGTGDGQFIYPFDVFVDKEGNIFVLDRGLGKTKHAFLQEFDSNGKFLLKIGGNATKIPQEDGKFLTPGGFAVDGKGFIYVIDSGYFYSPGNPFGYPAGVRLTKFDASGNFLLKKDYDVNSEGRLMNPWAACEDSKGNIWVTSWTNFSDTGEVDVFTSDGRFVKAIKGISNKELFTAIGGIASDGKGNIYIALGDYIAKFDENFNFIAKIGEKKVSNVFGISIDSSSGNIWVASNGTQSVVGFKPDGTLINQFTPAHAPVGLCLDNKGNFYVTTVDDNKLYLYSSSGKLIKSIGGGGRAVGKFWIPYGVIVDKDGNVLVADTENGRIQAFKADTYELLWSSKREFYEIAMLSLTKDGNIIAADCFHNVVRILSNTPPLSSNYKFEAKVSSSNIEVKAGDSTNLNLIVKNLGVLDDSYVLKVENYLPSGWTVTAIPDKIDVKVNDQSIIPLSITTSSSAKPKESGKVFISVSSVNNPRLIVSLVITVSIPEAPPVNVSIVGDRIGLGQSTTIKVMTEKVEELYGVSMTIQYDSTFLKVDKVEAGGILGQDAVFLENHDKLGTIIVGYSLKGKAQGVTGDGAIAFISFTGLKEGNTSIEFTEFSMFDSKGNVIKSSHSSADILVYNPNPPTLTTNIQDGLTVSNPTFSVTGKTDPGCKVTINGSPVNVGADGGFSTSVYLSEGANTITIVSTSKYNISNKIVRTVYLKTATVIVLQIGKSTFTVNGEERTLDAPPMIKNGRTLLPIRAVVEALGGTVAWDNAQKKVTIVLKDTTIELWIGKNVAKVNGVNKPIDSTNSKVVPEIVNGRTMLPLRFVTENLGATVDWDNNTKTVTITYKP
mgnify:CR=1 FL=1